MFLEVFIQVIGFIAIAFNLLAVQFNSHAKIVIMKTVGSFLFGVQYLLLSAYTGVVMEFIGWIRNIIFIRLVKKNKNTKPWIIFFSLITVVIGVTTIALSWQASVKAVLWLGGGYTFATVLTVGISILAIIAKVLSTVAYGINDAHKIRMINVPSCSCWLVYNFVTFSIAGIINEAMSLCSIAIAEWRYKTPKTKTETVSASEQPTDE